ncbi:Gfo/Idh/MocA family protein [Bacillus rubiinfantis]|uniref:Gfo/Idh/MocA family protein n=1 Tax=Bacillus rubiinfantis TaxID=1499680 RepID=UPI0005A652F3|nr:Gfo/Idh/MocA family oxidoreductase [Bacillus rubiinfantis]
MVKIGVIGLGDIAQKAYLPVYSKIKDAEFHFYTRNHEKLQDICAQYRFEHVHFDFESLIQSGITGAFVHSSTSSHEEIVNCLLQHGIHVFVDKPITDYFDGAKKLVELAEEKGLILMTGFNRRFAPAYGRLKQISQPNMVMVQKNRQNQPSAPRIFIFDDFIHVVDTMRYLFPHPIEDLLVNGRMENGALYQVVIQFISQGGTAIGIMNRESAVNEEIAQVMGAKEKGTVNNVSQLVISKGMENCEIRSSDWEPMLKKRGFQSMVRDFIDAVKLNRSPSISAWDALQTHEICEEIIAKLIEKHL